MSRCWSKLGWKGWLLCPQFFDRTAFSVNVALDTALKVEAARYDAATWHVCVCGAYTGEDVSSHCDRDSEGPDDYAAGCGA